jgi:DNA-binding response OmpR family regulator
MDTLEPQFEQHIAEALADESPAGECGADAAPARVLLAAADAQVRQGIESLLQGRGHRVTSVARVEDARSAVPRQRFDAIIVGPMAHEPESIELLRFLQKTVPAGKTIVISKGVTAADAVQAMRCGAVDIIALPLEPNDFLQRVESAVLKSRAEGQREQRLSRLKRICHELNVARHEISKQVDGLCDDLSHVYEDIAEQMSDVAMAAEFRTLLRQELDVEEVLRTTLEYLLTKTGPTNAAVFLPDGGSLVKGKPTMFGLGAYVNCDCPRETIAAMLDHVGGAICPQMAEESEIVRFADAEEFSEWIGADAECLADSQVLAFKCAHKNECLAVIVLFRKKAQKFDEKLAGVLDTLRGIIAEQLKNVVKVHHRATPGWPKEAKDGDLDYGLSESDDHYGFGPQEGGLAA